MGEGTIGNDESRRALANSSDKRVIKTRRAIREALARLITERDLADITAKDVADEALISKKTFLAHYASVQDAVDEMEDDAVDDISRLMDEAAGDEGRMGRALDELFSLAHDAKSDVGALMHSRARNDLMSRVRQLLAERVEGSRSAAAELGHKVSAKADYLAGGISSLLQRWLTDDDDADGQTLRSQGKDLANFIVTALRGDDAPKADGPSDNA